SHHSYLAKAWGLALAMAVVAVFASRRASLLVPVALSLGIGCNLQGLAMSWMLPVWRRDVKTLRAAWRLRKELQGNEARSACAFTPAITAALMLCLLTAPLFALEPGQAAYAGGTAKVALD